MQTLTERSATRPGPAGTLEEGKIRRFDSRIIPPKKVQLGQELDDGKGPSRVTLSVTGLTVKVTAGFSWLYRLLAGPPLRYGGPPEAQGHGHLLGLPAHPRLPLAFASAGLGVVPQFPGGR